MRSFQIRRFGDRLRKRIKAAGFSNVSTLLTALRINMTFISKMTRGTQTDAGVMKIAQIAIMLGRKPSELVAELDDLLLNPPPIDAETFAELGLRGRLEDYDPFRLAVLVDVVLGWDEEVNRSLDQRALADMIVALYDDLVRPERSIEHLQLRRRAMAFLFEVELPEPQTAPRGRGRPATSAAA